MGGEGVWGRGEGGGVNKRTTLLASLSGTVLQTLPELVTPQWAVFISAQLSMHRRGQRPPKGLGTKTVEAI